MIFLGTPQFKFPFSSRIHRTREFFPHRNYLFFANLKHYLWPSLSWMEISKTTYLYIEIYVFLEISVDSTLWRQAKCFKVPFITHWIKSWLGCSVANSIPPAILLSFEGYQGTIQSFLENNTENREDLFIF